MNDKGERYMKLRVPFILHMQQNVRQQLQNT